MNSLRCNVLKDLNVNKKEYNFGLKNKYINRIYQRINHKNAKNIAFELSIKIKIASKIISLWIILDYEVCKITTYFILYTWEKERGVGV